jgi:hypothetical protein
MLKRNGETCEHSVPDYPGLLTDSELKAYVEVLPSVEPLLREFNAGATALADIEKQIPKLAKQVVDNVAKDKEAITIRGQDTTWQVQRTLHKSARNELLFCARETGQATQFGIIERFAHNSVYAQVHGNTDLLMTSNQPSLLLQDHLENERRILHTFQKDIETSAEEALAEKFPGQNHSRVVRAISARCKTQFPAEKRNATAEKQTRNVRVRF